MLCVPPKFPGGDGRQLVKISAELMSGLDAVPASMLSIAVRTSVGKIRSGSLPVEVLGTGTDVSKGERLV